MRKIPFLAIFAALAGFAIGTYRERSILGNQNSFWNGYSAGAEENQILEGYHIEKDHIEEDEPGWDCSTMGNKICGVSKKYPGPY